MQGCQDHCFYAENRVVLEQKKLDLDGKSKSAGAICGGGGGGLIGIKSNPLWKTKAMAYKL